MSAQPDFEHIRRLDTAKFATLGPEDRYGEELVSGGDWVAGAAINYVHTAPGLGSPRGLHTHHFDKVLVIVEGVMDVEIEGSGHSRLNPGDAAIIPAETPHRNWNDGDVTAYHLSITSAPITSDEPVQ